MPKANNGTRAKPLPLEERITFLIHRINASISRACDPYYDKWGVDTITSRILAALHEKGSLSAGELDRIMGLPQSTISQRIKKLENQGFVCRTNSPSDSRVVLVELTKSGREIAIAGHELSYRMLDQLRNSIGQERLAELRRDLLILDRELRDFQI